MDIRKRSVVANGNENPKTKIIIITGDEQLINCFQQKQNTNRSQTQIFNLDTNFNGNVQELALLSELTDHNETDDHIYQHMLRSPSTTYTVDVQNRTTTTSTIKSKKGNFVCVVCGGKALGYNYDAITCGSCKSFFNRNALQSIDRLACLGSENCKITNARKQCKRCRLKRCFSMGMRKDFILSPEERLRRKKRLEENNQLLSHTDAVIVDETNYYYQQDNNNVTTIQNSTDITTVIDKVLFTNEDHLQIQCIQTSFMISQQSAVRPLIPYQIKDKMEALTYMMDMQNFTALKLIDYLKLIPEFKQLDDNDRFILVKYNLLYAFVLAKSLDFDYINGTCRSESSNESIQQRKVLSTLCQFEELRQTFLQLISTLINITENNQSIIHLLIIVTIFSKGISASDNQPTLSNFAQVYVAQCKYVDLLWRYMLQQYDDMVAVKKFSKLMTEILKIQIATRNYQLHMRNQIDDLDKINPLMKSLLHLT
ncbi:unnamed protein product [Didymodactylos carnosus]|uniref:Nuclear receptor n=1 Tax=Didymodactylos carnosus TaxID=1234261 RepID=A0A814AU12_9BILA|nr:unnamed protein product [Didymodactylos carnosus]CAF0917004.1 unnamed protein product [Didymodactylos carnosus]CAF3587423.1 unnamed protein product [Didymodactylos carnosus]CAF3697010.1 unnamed protein product [Didymodactylos carnosus]